MRPDRCPECYRRKDAHHIALGRCPEQDPPPKPKRPRKPGGLAKQIEDMP